MKANRIIWATLAIIVWMCICSIFTDNVLIWAILFCPPASAYFLFAAYCVEFPNWHEEQMLNYLTNLVTSQTNQ